MDDNNLQVSWEAAKLIELVGFHIMFDFIEC
jgi:hypothetical protein